MEHTARTGLDKKTVIVTGGSRGIGLSIAQAAADAGANVVVASRKQEGVDAAAEEIRSAGGSVLAVAAHMGDPAAVANLFERARAEFGQVDGLVNNAATNPYFGPMLAIEDAAFDKTIEVNLKGPLAASRAFAAQGHAGTIVNIASIAGMRAAPLQGVYGMTKAALISMTQTLAHELGGVGIRVNAICPGLVETRFASALIENKEILEQVNEKSALKRHGQPVEIAGAAVYLLSDASSFMTGQTIVIDGGTTAN
jgi:NAD(P)-dependent dehydrogenase (short-subunit alcohol dehydrogenase family)